MNGNQTKRSPVSITFVALMSLRNMAQPRSFFATLCWGLALLAAASSAFAHDPGLSTCELHVQGNSIIARMTISQADVESIVPLDKDHDGGVSGAEFVAAMTRLEEIARDAWSMRVGEASIPSEAVACTMDETNNVHFSIPFQTSVTDNLTASCRLLDQLPRGHRQFVTLVDAKGTVHAQALLSADMNILTANFTQSLHAEKPAKPVSQTFIAFVKLGVEHIVTGYDHLLFLFALLLVIPTLRSAAIIITCFTIAHSITLGLSTLNLAQVPSRIVEPLIAATIVYVGVENLFVRGVDRWRWMITLAFGLLHGFGFAGGLREMGIASTTSGVAIPLLSFNLGVEIGQIAIAAVVLPALWWFRRHPTFSERWQPSLSVLISVLGSWWLFERMFLTRVG